MLQTSRDDSRMQQRLEPLDYPRPADSPLERAGMSVYTYNVNTSSLELQGASRDAEGAIGVETVRGFSETQPSVMYGAFRAKHRTACEYRDTFSQQNTCSHSRTPAPAPPENASHAPIHQNLTSVCTLPCDDGRPVPLVFYVVLSRAVESAVGRGFRRVDLRGNGTANLART